MKKEKVEVDVSYESILRVFLISFVLLFLFYIREVIFTVFVSVLLVLIMDPAVDKMKKERNIPRVFGAGILFASLIAVMGILIYAVAPPLAREVSQLASNLPGYVNGLDFDSIKNNGQNFGIMASDFQGILTDISSALKNATVFIFTGAMGLVGGIFSAILVLVISFYLVVEEDGIDKFVKAIFPREIQSQSMRIIRKVENKLGRWFVGQVTLGFIIGFLSFIGLYLIGVPYALVLAIIAGLLELVPYIGPILSAIPAVIIAFTVSPTIAAMTFVLYFFIQEFENYLIVPKVMEKSVGLHPIIIIIAAIIGGQLGGIIGMILAIPITTIISIIIEDIAEEKRKRNS